MRFYRLSFGLIIVTAHQLLVSSVRLYKLSIGLVIVTTHQLLVSSVRLYRLSFGLIIVTTSQLSIAFRMRFYRLSFGLIIVTAHQLLVSSVRLYKLSIGLVIVTTHQLLVSSVRLYRLSFGLIIVTAHQLLAFGVRLYRLSLGLVIVTTHQLLAFGVRLYRLSFGLVIIKLLVSSKLFISSGRSELSFIGMNSSIFTRSHRRTLSRLKVLFSLNRCHFSGLSFSCSFRLSGFLDSLTQATARARGSTLRTRHFGGSFLRSGNAVILVSFLDNLVDGTRDSTHNRASSLFFMRLVLVMAANATNGTMFGSFF